MIWLPVLIAVVGLLVWAFSANGKVASIGLAVFTAAAGVIILLAYSGDVPVLPRHR